MVAHFVETDCSVDEIIVLTCAAEWAESDQVSMIAEQALGDSGALTLLVEKDFNCLSPGHHRPDEDNDDTYPHPEAASGGGR